MAIGWATGPLDAGEGEVPADSSWLHDANPRGMMASDKPITALLRPTLMTNETAEAAPRFQVLLYTRWTAPAQGRAKTAPRMGAVPRWP